MSETEYSGMRAVLDRLTRQEERGMARDAAFEKMQATLEKMDARLDDLANDLRDAKTGLRIGVWIASTVAPGLAAVAGWFAHTFMGK